MGKSNLQTSLERKYASWRGEQKELDAEIKKIEAEYEALDVKRDRLSHLGRLVECSEVIFAEIAPELDPHKIRLKIAKRYKLPFEPGIVTREALDILRTASEPISSRRIARMILERHGMADADSNLVDEVRSAVDASLRGKRGKVVEGIGEYPIKWRVIQWQDRPAAG